jgi:hypothetical protein
MAIRTVLEILADIKKNRYVPEVIAFSDTRYGRVSICVYSCWADDPVVLFKAQPYEKGAGFLEGMYFQSFSEALEAIGVPKE